MESKDTSQNMATILETYLGLVTQREIVQKYSLCHAIDESLAALDGGKITYLGFSVNRGPTRLARLKSMETTLKNLLLPGN